MNDLLMSMAWLAGAAVWALPLGVVVVVCVLLEVDAIHAARQDAEALVLGEVARG